MPTEQDADDAQRRLSAALSICRHQCITVELDDPLTASFLEVVSPEAILLVLVGPHWSASGSLSLSKKALDIAEARRIRVIALFHDLVELPPLEQLPPVLQPRPMKLSSWFTEDTWDSELKSLNNVIECPTTGTLLGEVLQRGSAIECIWAACAQVADVCPGTVAERDYLRRFLRVLLNTTEHVMCSVFAPFTATDGNVLGYAAGRSIAVSPINPLPHKTRFHELTHVLLATPWRASNTTESGRRGTCASARRRRSALLCYAALHLPGVQFCRGYIQSWWGAGNAIPERSAQKILKAADQILKAGAADGGEVLA